MRPGTFIDSDAPQLRAFAARHTAGLSNDVERAVALYYAVRYGIRYDPYGIRLVKTDYIASRVAVVSSAYCIPKAVLLAAAARSFGIPSAIGLSDVRNHFTSRRLAARMGDRSLFLHHGYAVLRLGGTWVKAAPAFDAELCRRAGVRATEFDGRSDALLQEYDARDRRSMEYVRTHGIWSDLPYDRIAADFRGYYPVAFFNGEQHPDERFEDAAGAAAF